MMESPGICNFCYGTVVVDVSKSENCSNHGTARSRFSSSVSGPVKLLYQCKPVKAGCSSNVSKQKACNVSSVSKLFKN